MGDLDFKFSVSAIAIILAIAICIYVAVEKGLDNKQQNNVTAAVNADYTSTSFSETTTSSATFSSTSATTTVSSIQETSSALETTTYSETISETTPTSTSAVTIAATVVTETEVSSVSYSSSADYTELISTYQSQLVVIGDSIASGFSVYNRLPAERVLAQGCVAARSIHDYYYTVNGMNLDAIAATGVLKPKYVFMSMGMNDINMTTSQQYVENYTQNINDILAVSPESEIVVMSITPIASTTTFSTNSAIDSYNSALAAMVQSMSSQGIRIHYLDAAAALKDQYNCLGYSYSGGDGIHLAPAAYDVLLEKMICFIESLGM